MTLIIDTGCANLNSVRFALERLGKSCKISRNPDEIHQADRVILPGVGTADFAMTRLNAHRLIPVIHALKQPVMGICLGMQLFAMTSVEGSLPMLGLLSLKVNQLQTTTKPIVHMGWNTLHSLADHPLLHGITAGDSVYFNHSFALDVGPSTLAQCHYGHDFSAIIAHNNFFGTQFHPERSGSVGQRLLKNFLETPSC